MQTGSSPSQPKMYPWLSQCTGMLEENTHERCDHEMRLKGVAGDGDLGTPLQQAETGLPAGISQAMVHDVLPHNGGLQVQPQGQGMQLDAGELGVKVGPIC